MKKMSQQQLYSQEHLLAMVNLHDWSQFDKQLSEIPHNPIYRILPQMTIQYQRLRTALMKNDLSLKTYDLTKFILKQKTNNYYALMLRKDYVFNQIQENKQSVQLIDEQLEFINNLLSDNPKQYHLWTYKKDLLQQQKKNQQKTNDSFILKKQLTFLTVLLLQDQRNYHAWDYRFWLTTFYTQVQSQLIWTQKLIFYQQNNINFNLQQNQKEDMKYRIQQIKIIWKNVYSLWSYRLNLIRYLKQNLKQQTLLIEDQITKTLQFINSKQNLLNQCSWNYLFSLINLCQMKNQDLQRIQNCITQIPDNRFKLQTNLHILTLKISRNQQKTEQLNKKRKNILLKLLQKDQTRKSYYEYLLQEFKLQ